MSLWTLISTLMSVQSTVQMMEEFIIELKLKQFRVIIGFQTASTTIFIKIVTNYLQIISTISTLQLQIQVGVQATLNSVGNPVEQMAYSLDCFIIQSLVLIQFRIIWSILMAIFYIVAFFFQEQYWEIIKIVEKELIIIFLVYCNDYIPIQASLVSLLLFGYSYFTQQSKPYVTGELNYIDSQSTIICATSIILGSLIFSAKQNNFKEIVLPFFLIIASLNMLFVASIILQIIFTYFKKFSEIIDEVKQFIKNKIFSVFILHPSFNKLFELNSSKQARINKNIKKLEKNFQLKLKSC